MPEINTPPMGLMSIFKNVPGFRWALRAPPWATISPPLAGLGKGKKREAFSASSELYIPSAAVGDYFDERVVPGPFIAEGHDARGPGAKHFQVLVAGFRQRLKAPMPDGNRGHGFATPVFPVDDI